MAAGLREGRATLNGRDFGTKYRVRFTPDISEPQPFRLKRKAERVQQLKSRGGERHCISIRSIVEVPSRPVRCIKVDREDGLFLAGGATMPTHNTLLLTLHIIRRLFRTAAASSTPLSSGRPSRMCSIGCWPSSAHPVAAPAPGLAAVEGGNRG